MDFQLGVVLQIRVVELTTFVWKNRWVGRGWNFGIMKSFEKSPTKSYWWKFSFTWVDIYIYICFVVVNIRRCFIYLISTVEGFLKHQQYQSLSLVPRHNLSFMYEHPPKTVHLLQGIAKRPVKSRFWKSTLLVLTCHFGRPVVLCYY